MILTNITNFSRYEQLHPAFKLVSKSLVDKQILISEPGRIVLDGDNLFVNVAHTVGVDKAKQPLEMHKSYIDIHVLLEGSETIGYKATNDITSYCQEYDKDSDCAVSKEVGTSYVTLSVGDICIVYPEDAHAPLIGNGTIKKLVFKIKL